MSAEAAGRDRRGVGVGAGAALAVGDGGRHQRVPAAAQEGRGVDGARRLAGRRRAAGPGRRLGRGPQGPLPGAGRPLLLRQIGRHQSEPLCVMKIRQNPVISSTPPDRTKVADVSG